MGDEIPKGRGGDHQTQVDIRVIRSGRVREKGEERESKEVERERESREKPTQKKGGGGT